MEKEFYQKIDTKLKSLLDNNVPELILKENRRLNEILKLRNGDENKNIIQNILQIKGYNTISINNTVYHTTLSKDDSPCTFDIYTDNECGLNIEGSDLVSFPYPSEEIKFMGCLIPKKNIIGFISTKKIISILQSKNKTENGLILMPLDEFKMHFQILNI